MKALILTAILLLTGLIAYNVTAGDDDALSGTLTVDFATSTVIYTEQHDFSMTATVPENDCNRCIKEKGGSECLVECNQSIIYVE